ncbi:hypothetical protein NDU88_001036 [Pleurodeles waltl]|uniref:Uncharacterized protein n=1 Tax=Pleurodeles waltl TaxID=8319 RepID=A0AAV7TIK7_PLEWA|nr:hypothetical protein NDU88_001036 [Pleurodeles waltl]
MGPDSFLDMHGPQPTAIYDLPVDHSPGPVSSTLGQRPRNHCGPALGAAQHQAATPNIHSGTLPGTRHWCAGPQQRPPHSGTRKTQKYPRPPEPDWLQLDLTAPEARED